MYFAFGNCVLIHPKFRQYITIYHGFKMVMESSKAGDVNFTATQQQYYFFLPFRFIQGAELKKKGF